MTLNRRLSRMKKKVLSGLTAIAGIAITLPTIVVQGHEEKLLTTNLQMQSGNVDSLRYQEFELHRLEQNGPQHNDDKRRKMQVAAGINHRERTNHDIRRLNAQQILFLQVLEQDMQQQNAVASTEEDQGYYITVDNANATELFTAQAKGNNTKGTKAPKETKLPKARKATKAPKASKAPKSVKSGFPSFSPTTTMSPTTSLSPSPTFSFSPSPTENPSQSPSSQPTTTPKKKKKGSKGKKIKITVREGDRRMMSKGGTDKGQPNAIAKVKDKKKNLKLIASDFPSIAPFISSTPSPSPSSFFIPTSFSSTPSPSPTTDFTSLPTITSIPTMSPSPTLSIQPTICENPKKGGPKDKDEPKGKGMMMMGKKGMMMGKKGMMMAKKVMMKGKRGMVMGSKDMGKGKTSKKGIDCPEPTFSPSPSMTNVPTITGFPTITAYPTSISDCRPTSGTCNSFAADLQNELDQASFGDVVALCGGNTMVVDRAIFLTQDSITLCCSDVDCTMVGTGSDSLLIVQGQSVTLQDIRFEDGYGASFDGGNVAIQAEGTHYILRCDFINGTTNEAGGNLFVDTTGTLVIGNSTFVDGVAGTGGGGLAVLDAAVVAIGYSDFVNNNAATGGGFYGVMDPALSGTSNIAIQDSYFISNSADTGGGIFVGKGAPGTTVQISSNSFFNNQVTQSGGAGLFLQPVDSLLLFINSNTGSGNTAGNTASSPLCSDFWTLQTTNSKTPSCIAVDGQFP